MRRNQFLEKTKARLTKYSTYFFILLAVVVLVSLFRNLSRVVGARKRIENTQKRVEKLRQENAEIERRLAEVKGEEFIEKQLRDRLGLAKEGEIVVVLPDEEILRKVAPAATEEEEVLPDPTWKRWLNLFY